MKSNLIRTQYLLDYMLLHKLSKKEFSKLCGISYSSLNKILENNINIDIFTIFKIAKTINVPMSKIFDDSEFEKLFQKNQ